MAPPVSPGSAVGRGSVPPPQAPSGSAIGRAAPSPTGGSQIGRSAPAGVPAAQPLPGAMPLPQAGLRSRRPQRKTNWDAPDGQPGEQDASVRRQVKEDNIRLPLA